MSLQDKFGLSPWLSFVATLGVMVVLGILIERIVLRPLVNQPQISLFMVTIGLTFVLEGLAQLFWGTEPRPLNLGIEDAPIGWLLDRHNIMVSSFDVVAALAAGVLVALLAVFFNRTRIGRALRAVADDHQGALAVGIPLKQIWAIVWSVAGFVALAAGLLWGARSSGVQFALTFTALKALPVLILGRLRLHRRCHRRRADHRRLGEARRGLPRALRRRRDRGLVRLCHGAAVPAGAARGIVRGEAH